VSRSRAAALLAYLVPLAGPLAVLGIRRDDLFARYHAAQALTAQAVMIGAPLIWLVLSWGLTWLPTAGPLLVVVLFALVLAVLLLMLLALLVGAVNALRGAVRPIPLIGERAERLSATAAPPASAPEPAIEPSGPTTT
jgi:uncharacterized membrane protein